MGRPIKSDEQSRVRALHVAKTTEHVENFRLAMAVLLPAYGVSAKATAELLGRNRYWVSRARNRFIEGKPFTVGAPGRGGRRHGLLAVDEEAALLRKAVIAVSQSEKPILGNVEEHFERLLAEEHSLSPAKSTIRRMLVRAAAQIYPGANRRQIWANGAVLRLIRAQIALAEAEAEVRKQWHL